jgi:hypothetical protein
LQVEYQTGAGALPDYWYLQFESPKGYVWETPSLGNQFDLEASDASALIPAYINEPNL